MQKIKLPILITVFLVPVCWKCSLEHTPLNTRLSPGLKEKPMLSTLLHCKDNKGLRYTVGKGRNKVSTKMKGEEEPGAQSTGKRKSQEHSPRVRVFSTQAVVSLSCTDAGSLDIGDSEVQKQSKTTDGRWKPEFVSNSHPVLATQPASGRGSRAEPRCRTPLR